MPTKDNSPFVGEDGRVYYNYALGAEYELRPQYGAPFVYRITDCEYENGKEYYRVESAGKEIGSRFTLKQLNDVLRLMPCEEINKGKRLELPLLAEEVTAYYSAKQKEVNRSNAAANKKLKSTDYFRNVSALRTLKETMQLLIADGEVSRADELANKIRTLTEAQEKILSDNGVDYKILTKAASCELCGDSGFVLGRICKCAIDQADKIKVFNAGLRKQLR